MREISVCLNVVFTFFYVFIAVDGVVSAGFVPQTSIGQGMG